MLCLIAALGRNRVLGHEGRLPWHLPHDMGRFQRLTLGSPLIMGRKTFESLGRPLRDRLNIVMTRGALHDTGATQVGSLEEALSAACAFNEQRGKDLTFVIGGGEVYREALPVADCMYLTEVELSPQGDTFFPRFSSEHWTEVSRQEHAGEPPYAFVTYHPRHTRDRSRDPL